MNSAEYQSKRIESWRVRGPLPLSPPLPSAAVGVLLWWRVLGGVTVCFVDRRCLKVFLP